MNNFINRFYVEIQSVEKKDKYEVWALYENHNFFDKVNYITATVNEGGGGGGHSQKDFSSESFELLTSQQQQKQKYHVKDGFSTIVLCM